uniref:Serine/threonine-protein phosphatase n=2 Tax=Lutzomyia longipalpis TaxID=7200 RepID=A0A1B0CWS4_LUTLO
MIYDASSQGKCEIYQGQLYLRMMLEFNGDLTCLFVLDQNGLPSPENPYVFNGDFVDRGKKSLEVFLLLLACLLVFPGGVFLNRGNHEDSVMNARYGFIREVHQKYKHNAERLLKMIEGVYRWLPLGTIVNNRVLVVHGGISDSTDLDLVKSLDRGKYASLLRPPIMEGSAPGVDMIDRVFDILWSDPQHNEGCRPNSLRGAGTYFGPDVSKEFLQRHKLTYIVRSHECKPDGHEMVHDGRVITIFSASNYYEIGSNKGAYLKLDPQLDIHFVQYTSAASKARKLTFRQRVGLVESSAIRELAEQLRNRRDELEQEFLSRDDTKSGYLTLAKWCEAMEAATFLGLPWRLLRDRLAPLDPNQSPTSVKYSKTLELLDSDTMKSNPGSASVAESLYRNKTSLEAIFRILDKDNSGHISLEEFGEACHILHKHLPEHGTEAELLDMCKMMDINKDGLVDLNEFLEAFRLCDQARRGLRKPLNEILSLDEDHMGYKENGSLAKRSEKADDQPEHKVKTTVTEDEDDAESEDESDYTDQIQDEGKTKNAPHAPKDEDL